MAPLAPRAVRDLTHKYSIFFYIWTSLLFFYEYLYHYINEIQIILQSHSNRFLFSLPQLSIWMEIFLGRCVSDASISRKMDIVKLDPCGHWNESMYPIVQIPCTITPTKCVFSKVTWSITLDFGTKWGIQVFCWSIASIISDSYSVGSAFAFLMCL